LLGEINRAILTPFCQEPAATDAPRRSAVRHHPDPARRRAAGDRAALAGKLEVTPDDLSRHCRPAGELVPIEGAAGIGYVLRRGFDLPPLMFTSEEIDAIAVGARLVRRLKDPKLQVAAESVLGKLAEVLPQALRAQLGGAPYYVSEGNSPAVSGLDFAELRRAIHATRKMSIDYSDDRGRRTRRTIWPLAMAYYVDVTLVAAWCELRNDFRHSRVDRIAAARLLDECFPPDNGKLMADWLALRKDRPIV
jgi:predicted DNA-binding transcriptional regulator YafY